MKDWMIAHNNDIMIAAWLLFVYAMIGLYLSENNGTYSFKRDVSYTLFWPIYVLIRLINFFRNRL